jgi:hypothetical protein
MRKQVGLHADHTYYMPHMSEVVLGRLCLEGERIGNSRNQSPPSGGYGGRTRPMNLPSILFFYNKKGLSTIVEWQLTHNKPKRTFIDISYIRIGTVRVNRKEFLMSIGCNI